MHGSLDWPAARSAIARQHKFFKWLGIVAGGFICLVLVLLALANTNVLKGLVEGIASASLNRDVRIEGDMHLYPSFSPTVTLDQLKISNPDWAGKEDMLTVDRLTVQIKLLPLLIGRVVLPVLDVQKPDVRLVRDKSGRANWSFESADGKTSSEPSRIPPIRHFGIHDGKLRITDRERKLTFVGSVSSYEEDSKKKRAFGLVGEGTMNGKPFHLNISGDPLLNVSSSDPYPFKADLRAGNTHIVANGSIAEPFDLGGFTLALKLTGSDLADLYYITGLTLPNTPPYNLSGTLVRNDTFFEFNKFTGKVGDSDLGGDLSVETKNERPYLEATLRSKRLDFDDLGALFGAPPSTDTGETASAEQKKQSSKMDANNRLLPDATLQVERVRAMDAKVHYEAQSVNAPNLPLEKVALDLTLDNGVLSLKPVSFSFPQGKLSGNVIIDARKDVPQVDLDMRLSKMRLESLVETKAGDKPAIEGAVLARAKLHGSGNSVHKAASTADGTLTFVVPSGEIRKAFAELMGINITTGLGLLLAESDKQTELRCAVADFEAKDGVLRAKTVVLDTNVVLATGKGTIDLKTEKLDLRLEGEPKKARIRVMAPITIKGHLRSPSIGIDPTKTIAQAGAATVLGIFLTPLAAILPFVDPGLGDDANCRGLMQAAKESSGNAVAPTPAQLNAPRSTK